MFTKMPRSENKICIILINIKNRMTTNAFYLLDTILPKKLGFSV